MTIGISAFAGDGGRSGIGQYLSHVISRLPEEAPDERFVVFTTREAVGDLDDEVPGGVEVHRPVGL